MHAYAWVPLLDQVQGDYYKVYFASRNKDNLSQVGYILIDINNPAKIIEISKYPVLELGPLGAFDDSAVLPSCIVNRKGKKYLYYVGWTQGKRVPFYSALGLAVSEDNGRTFQKYSKAPLLSRNNIDPFFTASAYVMLQNGLWRMWYTTNTAWRMISKEILPKYHIKYAESKDGFDWTRKGTVAIDFNNEEEYAISRPWVIFEEGIYKMWYSYRGKAYRIGYAESKDGIKWTREDKRAGIDVSENGWDSEMIEYACVIDHNGKKYMVYNGNEYGKNGIGMAVEN